MPPRRWFSLFSRGTLPDDRRYDSSSTYSSPTTPSSAPTYVSRKTRPPSYSSRVPAAQTLADTVSLTNQCTETESVVDSSRNVARDSRPRYSMLYSFHPPSPLNLRSSVVYYRLYNKNRPIKSKHPISADDPSVMSLSITPPHTVGNLKRCICRFESDADSFSARLFISITSQEPMTNNSRVSILGSGGPGHSPEDPLALVIKSRHSDTLVEHPPRPLDSNSRAVYYRLYTKDGSIKSKNPVSADNPSLAHVMSSLVPPPHTVTVGTLKRCMCKLESDADHTSTRLFVSVTSQQPMTDRSHVSIRGSGGPGHSPDDPMALVINLRDSEVFVKHTLRDQESCQTASFVPAFSRYGK
jgi:hypothetical protein